MGIKKLFVVQGMFFDNKMEAKEHRELLIGQGKSGVYVKRGPDNFKSARNGRKPHTIGGVK